jgi:hypothetical protein
MSSYFTEIFDGKTIFNTEDELNNLQNKIKAGNWHENQYNEAKLIIPNKKSWDLENKANLLLESQIIKPIVGILNSIEGNGTLYLGIDTNDGNGPRNNKFEKIVPVIQDIIKDKSSLQSLIYVKSGGNVGIYPNYSEPPEININSISCFNGNIFIVNVQRKDNNCVFYSKITNKIYKRYNDNTVELNLQEQIAFIESKRIAKIIISSNIKSNNLLELSYINKGNQLGKHIHNRMQVFCSENVNFEVYIRKLKGKQLKKPEGIFELTPSNNLINQHIIFDFIAGYPPSTLYLYPNIFVSLCDIQISGDGIFNIRFDIYEDKAKTIQTFRYKIENNILSKISEDDFADLYTYV